MQTETLELNVEHNFNVPVAKLYSAWISEEDLKQWWKPSGNELVNVDQEVKEGGNIKYEFVGKDEQPSLLITGKYSEVKENEKLVYSWNWDVSTDGVQKSDHKLTIAFLADGDNSKIQVTQDNFKDSESITPHQEGWEKALDSLGQYLG
ncbi:MAG: hypothetical protein EOP42_14975 [Sphingobacteriaceae bacterium]|nr:MAG: hypothetical protein EOP42_14975 [Sphingobacteriaceae bacterium]